MDINPKSSFSILMKEAMHRVDGLAMYLAVLVFFLGGLGLGVSNLFSGHSSFLAWKFVVASILMIPISVVIYFGLATFSSTNSSASRWVNAACLVGIPIYFYFKMF